MTKAGRPGCTSERASRRMRGWETACSIAALHRQLSGRSFSRPVAGLRQLAHVAASRLNRSDAGAPRLLLSCLLSRSSWLTVECDRQVGAAGVLDRRGGRAAVAVSVGMAVGVPIAELVGPSVTPLEASPSGRLRKWGQRASRSSTKPTCLGRGGRLPTAQRVSVSAICEATRPPALTPARSRERQRCALAERARRERPASASAECRSAWLSGSLRAERSDAAAAQDQHSGRRRRGLLLFESPSGAA